MAASNVNWWRVVQVVVAAAIVGCAAGLIRNGNRITALETHIPYIREALTDIKKVLEKKR